MARFTSGGKVNSSFPLLWEPAGEVWARLDVADEMTVKAVGRKKRKYYIRCAPGQLACPTCSKGGILNAASLALGSL